MAGPVNGSAVLTRAGATLRLDEPAVLSYQALNSGPDATKLEITVTEVASAPSTTCAGRSSSSVRTYPATPRGTSAHGSPTAAPATSPPCRTLDTGIILRDASGKSVKPAVFTGLFDLDVCERDGLLPPWKPGATSAACTVFLLPDGTEPASVTFPVVTTKFASTSAHDRVTWQR